jgi:hypothetical protein
VATMPVITDEMVDKLRRTGRSRSRERNETGAGGSAARVAPQQEISCIGKPDGWGPCFHYPDGTPLYCISQQCAAPKIL